MTYDTNADHDAQNLVNDTDIAREATVLDDLELGPRVAEWLARAS